MSRAQANGKFEIIYLILTKRYNEKGKILAGVEIIHANFIWLVLIISFIGLGSNDMRCRVGVKYHEIKMPRYVYVLQ